MNSLFIDIGVGGSFHAEYMARALLGAGHGVKLFTSYPASRFKLFPRSFIRSFVFPEIVFRAARKVGLENAGDLFKMQTFGRAMARAASKERRVDLCICWSSFGLEAFESGYAARSVVVRDSAHILFQERILSEEFRRFGVPYPNRGVCIDREMAEYELADRILVLSQFAKKTFVDRGFPQARIDTIPLGVDLSLFQPQENKAVRLPLKVLYFGTLSLQKGVQHLLEATAGIPRSAVQLELVGSVEPSFAPILSKYPHATYLPPMKHAELAPFIRQRDVFVFPTLHDGFGQTLVQAMASGLVPIATDHCGASELITDAVNGFVIAAGAPQAIGNRLTQLIESPDTVVQMGARAALLGTQFTWERYSETLTEWLCRTR